MLRIMDDPSASPIRIAIFISKFEDIWLNQILNKPEIL